MYIYPKEKSQGMEDLYFDSIWILVIGSNISFQGESDFRREISFELDFNFLICFAKFWTESNLVRLALKTLISKGARVLTQEGASTHSLSPLLLIFSVLKGSSLNLLWLELRLLGKARSWSNFSQEDL